MEQQKPLTSACGDARLGVGLAALSCARDFARDYLRAFTHDGVFHGNPEVLLMYGALDYNLKRELLERNPDADYNAIPGFTARGGR